MDKIKKHTRQLTLAATVLAILASGPQVSLANSAPPTGGAAKVQVNAALRILPSGLQNIPAPDAVNGYKFNAYRNRDITLNVYAENVDDLGAFSYKLQWPATLAEATGAELNANFLNNNSLCPNGPINSCINRTRDFTHLSRIDPNTGVLETFPKLELFYVEDAVYSIFYSAPGTGPTGSGALEQINILPKELGDMTLFFAASKLAKVDGTVITADTYNATMVVRASCMGDFDASGKVEINDVQTEAYNYNPAQQVGAPAYDLFYDLDNDTDIDIGDVQKVASRWNKLCSELSTDRVDSSPASKAAKTRMVTNLISAKVQASDTGNTLIVSAQNLERIGAFEIEMNYNAKTADIVSAELGDALSDSQRQWLALPLRKNPATGKAVFGAVSLGDGDVGLSGAGNLAKINLASLGKTSADARVLKITLLDVEGNVLAVVMPIQASGDMTSANK